MTGKGEALALALLGMVVHVAHVAKLVASLGEKRVQLPFCRRCNLECMLPPPGARLPLCGVILFAGASFYSMFALENRQLGFWLTVCWIVLMVVVIRRSAPHEARCMPVKVFLDNGRYRYFVHSGPFVEYFWAYPTSKNVETLKRNLILRYNHQPDVIKI